MRADYQSDYAESSALGLLGGFAVGAGLMYMLDPQRGGRRRAMLRDQLVRGGHVALDFGDKTARDLANRTKGVVAESWSSFRDRPVDDDTLLERVRAKLGRAVSHPRAVDVVCDDGCVTLQGTVLEAEVDDLIDAVCSVRGVQSVDPQLEIEKTPGNNPNLQGGSGRREQRRLDIMQSNWSPATRAMVGGVGAGLLILAATRRSWPAIAAGVAGFPLLARAGTNLESRRLFGLRGRRSIDLQKTIHVNAPVEEVYRFWANLENFPKIMSHVRSVAPTQNGGWRWTVDGPGKVPVSWNAVITEEIPGKMIAWRSEPGSVIANAGIVRFDQENGGTRIHVRLSYNPPGGAFGHGIASLFGMDPKHQMDDDLARFKSLIEIGKTTAHHRRVTRDELAV